MKATEKRNKTEGLEIFPNLKPITEVDIPDMKTFIASESKTMGGRFILVCLALQALSYILVVMEVDFFGVDSSNFMRSISRGWWSEVVGAFIPMFVLGGGYIVRWIVLGANRKHA